MEKIIHNTPTQTFQTDAFIFEREKWAQNAIICGIDEVGRGCLFGPVVACCAILKPFSAHPLLKDSKILTETQRREAALWIKAHSWYAFGIIDHREIDQYNIYEATKAAMKKAYFGLAAQLVGTPDTVLIDAVPLYFGTNGPKVISMTKGESKSVSIAAASILAKVHRDFIMERLGKQFPGYALEKNKGYGAQVHTDALQQKGESLLHRKSFLSSFKKNTGTHNESNEQQTSLFC